MSRQDRPSADIHRYDQAGDHAVQEPEGLTMNRDHEVTAVRGSASRREQPCVLILGGGFAGVQAARCLKRLPVKVVVIDKRNHHTFQPLLYQVALGVLSPADIAQPIRAMLRSQANVEVLLDEALSLDPKARQVRMASGAAMHYDYVVIATGSTHSYFGKDDWAAVAPGLKSIDDATEIRRRIITAFEVAEREMAHTGTPPKITFVVIGGGATGVELAGAISDISKNFMRGSFRNIKPGTAKVLLLEGGPSILASYPTDLAAKGLSQLKRLGVEVRTGAHVTDIQPSCVMLGAERIESSVTLWGAGVQGSALGKRLGLPLDSRGRVFVDAYLNPQGHRDIFVCGDLAHATEAGRDIPGVAQPAMQMGRHAARMIGQDLAGEARTSFHYVDRGDLATIGRFAAIARIDRPFRVHWAGLAAWLLWLMVHVLALTGFRNRLAVLCAWTYGMLTSRFGACLITEGRSEASAAHTARQEVRA